MDCILVFPKEFEFLLFIQSTKPKSVKHDNKHNVFHLYYDDKIVAATFFDKSDYEFMNMCKTFIEESSRSELTLILIGSCGSKIDQDKGKLYN